MILPAIISAKPASGGAPYVADAVHFAGAGTMVYSSSLTSTNSPNLTVSLWFKIASNLGTDPVPFFINDPESSASILISGFVAVNVFTSLQVYLEDSGADNQFILDVPALALPSTGAWHHFLLSVETNFAVGLKPFKIYIDDVDTAATASSEAGSFSMVTNGLPFFFGEDQGDHFVGDMADAFIAPGLSILTAGDIPEAKRRLFIDADGKPVDPAVAAAALGNPRILFSGNATTFDDNQGTGGAFVLSRYLQSGASPGPGPATFTLTGAVAGNGVYLVNKNDTVVTDEFEATISVNNQIQQTGSADYTDDNVRVVLTPGVLTNASTSPSD